MEVKVKEPDIVKEKKSQVTGFLDGYVKRKYPMLMAYEFFKGEARPAERYRSKLATKRKGG